MVKLYNQTNHATGYPQMKKSSSTESLILQAAEQIFFLRGYNGARMQEIADEASINKALLHYYFRSKEQLFEAVFEAAVARLVPPVLAVLHQELPLRDKISAFVDAYFTTVEENPFLPGFIVYELQRNPEHFRTTIEAERVDLLDKLQMQLHEGADNGTLRRMSAEQFMLNLFSLCAFPFIARQGMQALSGRNDQDYHLLLEERRKLIPGWILDTLRPDTVY
jgi:AcrR family transcriptional regulator